MKVDVPLKGMHCAGCVRTVEETVRGIPGILSASVNLVAERVTFEADPGTFNAPALVEALRQRGYRILADRKVFRVRGIDCPSRVAPLEARLRALPGMMAASVSYEGATVAVEYLSDADVEGVLRSEGLVPVAEESVGSGVKQTSSWIRCGASLVLAAVVMTLSMLDAGPWWLWMILAAPVQFWAGWTFHAGMLRSLRRGNADMNTLVSIGTNAAFFGSLLPGPAYFDGAAAIIAIVLLGRLLEDRARRGTRRAVERLLELAPRADVRPGEERWVKPGERFPADGAVLEGAGTVDESMLTGESLPVDKAAGDRVYGGSLNHTGALRVRFDRTGDDSALGRIVRLVRRTQETKPPAQRLADLWASRFVPAVLAAAVITFVVWMAIDPSLVLESTVAVLVVACPCAFGLATPAAIVTAAGAAARRGIIFKDASALEGLGRIDKIVFDKTGTLTEGRPRVLGVLPAPGYTSVKILALAASVERLSEHPLAQAVAAECPDAPPASDFEARPGLGALGKVDGHEVAVGNRAFMQILGIDLPEGGEPGVYVACDGVLAGGIAVADTPRPEAAETIRELARLGLRSMMLTGDDEATATAVAQIVGIPPEEIRSGVMPQDKAAALKALQADGPIGMVGDGINDAPALAQADAGIAVSRGTDAAVESADVLLMKNDLLRVPMAVRLSRAARRVIHQNFAWAIGYNALLIPLAAGAFRPLGIGLVPMAAAAAMALSSITVLLNSLRLGR